MTEETRSVPNSSAALNDELLRKDHKPGSPRRNTKEFIIEKILAVADENHLELQVSNTKLKRMNKEKLNALLGEMLAESVKVQMKEAVHASSTDDSVIALASLRMVHDIVATGVEQGLNSVLPPYGYRVDGFARGLKHPVTSQCIDDCLKEIAAENDVLQYIKSPYARLAIAWSGSMVGSIRRVRMAENKFRYNNNNRRNGPPNMGPRKTAPEVAV